MAGYSQEAHLAAVLEPLYPVSELLAQGLAHVLEQQIDPLELELLQPPLHIAFQTEAPEAPEKRPGQHDTQLVAVAGRQVADGLHHVAQVEQGGDVEIVDPVLMRGFLDGRRGYAVARRQPDPAHHQSCPAERNSLLEVHSRPPVCQACRGFAVDLDDAGLSTSDRWLAFPVISLLQLGSDHQRQ